MILLDIHIRDYLCLIRISFLEIVMQTVNVDLKWKTSILKNGGDSLF